jgi:predicted DNA-binding transcriptional regulator AlpA
MQRFDPSHIHRQGKLADRLSMSQATINKIIRNGELKSIQLGKRAKGVLESDILAYIESRRA